MWFKWGSSDASGDSSASSGDSSSSSGGSSDTIRVAIWDNNQLAFQVSCISNAPDSFALVKFLTGGDIAIGLFNMGDVQTMISINFWDIGLPAGSGYKLEFYDCIEHKDAGAKEEMFSTAVAAHGSKVYRCKAVRK